MTWNFLFKERRNLSIGRKTHHVPSTVPGPSGAKSVISLQLDTLEAGIPMPICRWGIREKGLAQSYAEQTSEE